MTRTALIAWSLTALVLGLTPVQAQPTLSDPTRALPASGYGMAGLPFGPDCAEERARLLSCLPRVYVSPDAPGVPQIIDAPSAQRRLPYPELFNW